MLFIFQARQAICLRIIEAAAILLIVMVVAAAAVDRSGLLRSTNWNYDVEEDVSLICYMDGSISFYTDVHNRTISAMNCIHSQPLVAIILLLFVSIRDCITTATTYVHNVTLITDLLLHIRIMALLSTFNSRKATNQN